VWTQYKKKCKIEKKRMESDKVEEYKRHDMSEEEWEKLSGHLPGQLHQRGGTAKDNRRFIDGVCWIIRTGAPWRDLPPYYGKWNTQAKRYRRWVKQGVWAKLLEIFADEPKLEWLLSKVHPLDASHCKVHPHAAGAVGGNQDMGRTKGGLTPKYTLQLMLAVASSGRLSLRVQ
jgi:transposase